MDRSIESAAEEKARELGEFFHGLREEAIRTGEDTEFFEYFTFPSSGVTGITFSDEVWKLLANDPYFIEEGSFTAVYDVPGHPEYVLKMNVCFEVDSGSDYWQYCLGNRGQPGIPEILMVRRTPEGIPWCVMRRYVEDTERAYHLIRYKELPLKDIREWAEYNGYEMDVHSGNVMFEVSDGEYKPVIVDPTSFVWA